MPEAFNFDWLMPGELFPIPLLGGGLLLWAAAHRAHWGFFAWRLGLAIGGLVGMMVLAVVTGLASGEIQPTGWPVLIVGAFYVVYVLAVVTMGVAGIWLLRRLFKRPKPSTPVG